MDTPKGILWRLIAQSEPRLADIICIDILEALLRLQDDASNQASILLISCWYWAFQTLYMLSRRVTFTANTDTLHLSQASTFGACEKDGITVIHALSRPHQRKAACRLPFLPRRERSRAV